MSFLVGHAYRGEPGHELDRIMGGLTRPVFGWVSDQIGREIAIFLAFGVEAFPVSAHPVRPGANHVRPHVGLGVLRLGAVFSLFPAVSGDMFGRKFATTNYSLLYTAKGSSVLVVALFNLATSSR